MKRPVLVVGLLAVLLTVVLGGCSGGADEPAVPPDASPTAAVAVPKAPRVGACYRLDVGAALRTSSTKRPVPCTSRHTAVTVSVGTVHPVVDGHLLALDSAVLQGRIADDCRHKVDAHVGGTPAQHRLSRVQAVWFNPTPAQADHGALWFRCDLVVSAGSRRFAALPKKTRGLLVAPGALSRWGTCGTAAPSSKAFQRVLCAAKHTWQARSTTILPANTRYLNTKAGKVADGRCRDVAAKLSPHSLRLRWAFEWPTRAQWRSGQRYGFCWTPA